MGWQRRPSAAITRTKTRKRDLLWGVFALLIAVGLIGAFYMVKIHKQPKHSISQTTKQTDSSLKKVQDSSTKPKITRLLATGDSIAHDAINGAAKQSDGSYTYTDMMTAMKPVLNSADIRFCNQSTQVGGETLGVSGYPDFNAPFSFATDLVSTGCNLITTASNHSSDKGKAAIDTNIDYWAKQKKLLAVAGQYSSTADHEAVRYFEQDGLKYAFLTYTTYTNHPPPTDYSVGMYSRDYASRQIVAAKAAGAKFIIVSMRWGTEYSQSINAYQLAESQFLADQGVQLILGHGAHVQQPVKRLTGKGGAQTLVWYGLGNFLHAQLEAETLFNGIAVIDIDPKTATITNVGFLPTYMHYDWTADQAAKQDLLARHNFALVPLQDATELFAKSQLKTTIEAQKSRLQTTLNTYTAVPFMTKQDLGL
jgi:poly-gamma-glutamate capsule biosynthesis protein CapA/YwtB (metallophosphatase superfamily)